MDLAIHMKAVLIGAVFAIVSRKSKLMLKCKLLSLALGICGGALESVIPKYMLQIKFLSPSGE